jgi:TPR repeat protein
MAMYYTGWCYQFGEGVSTDYHLAALWYSRAKAAGYPNAANSLSLLLRDHPKECAPFGRWRPAAEVHSLAPVAVRRAVATWLLIGRRRRLPHYAALLVCAFVVTGSGWEGLMEPDSASRSFGSE